jgi:uncharacterized UPF0146 family protein
MTTITKESLKQELEYFNDEQLKQVADFIAFIKFQTKIVTFLETKTIDLASHGINKAQAELLRTSLATFAEDWNSPEMSIYDDYDAAKAKL